MLSPLLCLRASILAVAAISLVLASGGSHIARAHGGLDGSNPRANSVVTKAPTEIVLHMSEAPDSAFSEIKVFNKEGERVDTGETRPSGPDSLEVALSDLEPGTYTVVWEVTSVSEGTGLPDHTVSR